uniref:NADH dehydrogenase [ubiquinone] iron-sulfur protein 3 n=1 Tax=Mesostigma viride TaxID=41882 RepID=Q8W9P9_MESVI|nr:NADH dehydrogenase subunit 9 [Mesostigma viride]AAL36759.1 NADH dehydrogenase subunit 9 [Mesostigma viride]
MNSFLINGAVEHIVAMVPKWIECVEYQKGEWSITVSNETVIDSFFHFLRDTEFAECEMLIDIAGVDYPSRLKRFEIVYQLLSIHYGQRIRVKVKVDELSPVPSVTNIYPSAGYFEREVWDMYGVFFSHHPDLRRILTDYGFEGYPLRKDFPLSGYFEVRYDLSKTRVIVEPLEMSQEFRYLETRNPWFLK